MLSEKQYDQIKKKKTMMDCKLFYSYYKKDYYTLIQKQSKNWMTLNKIIFKKYY